MRMSRFAVLAVVIFGVQGAANFVHAQTTQPAMPPAATQAALDPAAEHLLDLLEKAGDANKTIIADLKYELEETAFGDTELREGKVYYQSAAQNAAGDQSARFRIHFDTIKQGRTKIKEETDYVFTGQSFIIRKPKIKQQTEWVAGPGEKLSALKLGQGPFPVPFGQKKEDVLKLFDAAVKLHKSGPSGAGYLLLTAKPDTEMDIRKLEMWITLEGPLAGLPVKIISETPKSQQITTVTFTNIQSNQPLARDVFELPRPPSDWEYDHKPLHQNARIEP